MDSEEKQEVLDRRYIRMAGIWAENSYCRRRQVTASPCIECAKLIIQAGIKRVVYSEKYRLEDGIELMKRAGIEVVYLEHEQ